MIHFVSINMEKAFNKIQHIFMAKMANKLQIEDNK